MVPRGLKQHTLHENAHVWFYLHWLHWAVRNGKFKMKIYVSSGIRNQLPARFESKSSALDNPVTLVRYRLQFYSLPISWRMNNVTIHVWNRWYSDSQCIQDKIYISKRNANFVWQFKYTFNHYNQFDTCCHVIGLHVFVSNYPVEIKPQVVVSPAWPNDLARWITHDEKRA